MWQRNKLCAIDDFSESGVNASFAYLEKIQLRALDDVIWVASCSSSMLSITNTTALPWAMKPYLEKFILGGKVWT